MIPISPHFDGKTALHVAVLEGDPTAFEDALRLDPDGVDVRDGSGWTPLHYAAQHQRAGFVANLLMAGASVDVPNEAGLTALALAVGTYAGDTTTISLLMEAGADPDRKNRQGVSVRNIAAAVATLPPGLLGPARTPTASIPVQSEDADSPAAPLSWVDELDA